MINFNRNLLFIFFFAFIFFANIYSQKNYKVLAIRVEFQEDNSILTTGNGKFNLKETSLDSINLVIDPPPHNKSYFEDHLQYLANYFRQVSGNKINVEFSCYPQKEDSSYTLPQKMNYYNPNTTQEVINKGLAQLFYDSWQIASDDPEINFQDYNCFFIFHAGVGKDIAMIFDETSEDISSLYITPEFLQKYLPENLTPVVTQGAILPETESQEASDLALNGLVVSNFATFLGLPDMFNAKSQNSAIGIFDVMDVGLFNYQGLLPSLPMAWHRVQQKWDSAIVINNAKDSLLNIGSYNNPNLPSIYKFPITSSEYFLVEMRAPGKLFLDSLRYANAENNLLPNFKKILINYYPSLATFSPRGVLTDVANIDMGIPGNGILIWHIDENIIDTRLSNGEAINNAPEYKGVDLEEADGSQDIGEVFEYLSAGSGSENGWILDMFYEENNSPMYERNNGSFAHNTIPSSVSNYLQGNSQLKLYSFSNSDTVMSFKANFNLYENGYPVKLSENINIIKNFTGFYEDNKQELVLGSKSNVSVVNLENGEIKGNFNFDDSLKNILKLKNNIKTIVLVGTKKIEFLSYNGSFVNSTIDSLLENEKYSTCSVLPMGNEDYILLGTNLGSRKIIKSTANLDTSSIVFPSLGNAINKIYPFVLETETYLLYATTQGNSIVKLSDKTETNLPVISEKYGEITQGWVIKKLSNEVDFYFLTDKNNFIKYDIINNEFSHFVSQSLSEKSNPGILPLQWNNYGNWEVVFSTLSEKLELYNLQGASMLSFPQKIFNKHASAKYLESFPVLTKNINSNQEMFLPVLSTIYESSDNEKNNSKGTVLNLYDYSGQINSEYLLPISSSYENSIMFANENGQDTYLAITDSMKSLSLFRLPYHQYFTSAYLNLKNYNLNIFEEELEPQTESFVERKGLLPGNLVYNWPNPVKGATTNIRFHVTKNAKVKIIIYDQIGNKVWQKSSYAFANMDKEEIWDVSNVSSGVYFAKIYAQAENENEYKIIKIAVVK